MAEATSEEYRPSELRFTHNSIGARFRNGCSIDETLRSILDGDISVSDFPLMEVMEYQGMNYVVHGNRRLLLYRKLESRGRVTRVQVKKIPFDAVVFEKKHTTKNGGTSVWIRSSMGDDEDSDLDEW